MSLVSVSNVFELPIGKLPRCGPAIILRLKKIGIETVGDVLGHFPARYEDHSEVLDVSGLVAGEFGTVRVRVQQLRGRRAMYRRGMHVTEALVGDGTGSVRVVWFNQPFLTKTLSVGEEIFVSGKVAEDSFGLKFTSPIYERTDKNDTLHTARIVPIYGLTIGVGNKQFRSLVKSALDKVDAARPVHDWLPEEIRVENSLATYWHALEAIHFPENMHEVEESHLRFQFDQTFLHELNQRVVKRYTESVIGCALPLDVEIVKNFIAGLPFVLTDDQKKAVFAILKDMERSHPMNRLLQGDVGSGKTVVAAIAMRHAAAHGCTSILMAPTQLLAEQHSETLKKVLGPSEIPVVLITQSTKKTATLPKGPCVVVGTHALLYEKVVYPQLGLVVVDEQHRFGVAQRKAIKAKNKAGYTPHFLSMSATPIPRSLALAVYGSLAVSSIKHMPVGRKPIATRSVAEKDRGKAVDFVKQHVQRGEQVFAVAPLIDPSDFLSVESATSLYEQFSSDLFSGLRVGLVHGRMKPAERSKVMDAMRRGEIDILVATAVIEVGVDIPNATVMWIEGSERFGLAQLHQFRGRVGRGEKQSYCFLFSSSRGENANKRLKLMEEATDGFVLAEKDLEMRGGGQLWGTQQSGFAEIEFLREISLDIWDMARRAADKIMSDDSALAHHPVLALQLKQFEEELHRE